ncbi:MAG: LysR family transcriptional regulator [Gammaproteobacteria bacterium]|nr:LysR family transcriptional regulator [Gammaproteobacteria bacterium]
MSYSELGVTLLSLRHLKAVSVVCRLQSVTQAARHLRRSQSTITMAIKDIEKCLGVHLFNRVGRRIEPTVYATALNRGIEAAMQEFTTAARLHTKLIGNSSDVRPNPVFSIDISYKRYAALLALDKYSNVRLAADRLSISKTAVYKSVNELESQLSLKLFDRGKFETKSTLFCSQLSRHARLAFTHLRHAVDELAGIDGITCGKINIGMLPYSRSFLLPRAVGRLLEAYPELSILTREGTYSTLETPLMSGELDLIVGATRPGKKNKTLKSENLFEDKLVLVTSTSHPLAKLKKVSIDKLRNQYWLLPALDTPARQLFESFLERSGLMSPEHFIETSSLTFIRGLLLENDHVALLSAHQVSREVKHGMLSVLPVELGNTNRPIGIIMRNIPYQAPGLRLLISQLRQVVLELK